MFIICVRIFLSLLFCFVPFLLEAAVIGSMLTSNNQRLYNPVVERVTHRGLHISHKYGSAVLTPEEIDSRYHNILRIFIEEYNAAKKRYEEEAAAENAEENSGKNALEKLSASSKVITVSASGYGKNKDDALKDAMSNAVIKAVGAYIDSRTTVINETLKKEIRMSSYAVVTDYEELDVNLFNGEYAVMIKAKILPGRLQQYYPKLVTHKVTNTEVNNLLNQRKALKNAMESIPEIFRNYRLMMYRFNKRGTPQLAANDDFSSENVAVNIDFKAELDAEYFKKFESRLCSLLDKICLNKAQIPNNRRIRDDFAARLWRRARLRERDWERYRFIAFKTTENYKLYLLPGQIVQMIEDQVKSGSATIVCSMVLKNSTEKYRSFIRTYVLRFYSRDRYFYVTGNNGCRPLTFHNYFFMSNSNGLKLEHDRKYCLSTNGTMNLNMPLNIFENIREIHIHLLNSEENYWNDKSMNKIIEDSENILNSLKKIP